MNMVLSNYEQLGNIVEDHWMGRETPKRGRGGGADKALKAWTGALGIDR